MPIDLGIKMSVVTTIDRVNFAAILDLLGSATERVIIVTYSFETRRDTPLWRALKSIRPEVKLTIIACIPDCAMNFHRTIEAESASKIARYYSALDPKNFSNTAEVFLCHHNHAKLIVCDNSAYVGSANFTQGSSKNFEAGYVTHDPIEARQLAQFAAKIKDRGIPFFKIGASLFVQQLLQFAADASWWSEQVSESCYIERQVYKDSWESEFSLEQFGVPTRVLEAIDAALTAAKMIDAKKVGLTEGEKALAEGGVLSLLEDLREEADAINTRDRLKKEVTESSAVDSLLPEYLLQDNPSENPDLRYRALRLVDGNRAERTVEAKEHLDEFLGQLEDVEKFILSALRDN